MAENLKPRQSAVRILIRILAEGLTTDKAIEIEKDYGAYSESDRHFIRLLIMTTLRRLGQIDGVLNKLLNRPLPGKQRTVLMILRLAVAQFLFLKTPDYAVVHTAVSLTRRFHFDGLTGLVNGVLRHLIRLQNPLQGLENPEVNLPNWLYRSWVQTYGETTSKGIAATVLIPPPLDITVLKHPEQSAQKWNGQILSTGSIRVPVSVPTELADFETECCWVQNAAASVPAQLLTKPRGKKIADLCAAPGGKTAQLAGMGAFVTAFDISENRLKRLRENMERLGLSDQVRVIAADALTIPSEQQFDAVLLDAPCSATGTLARHPEIKYHRTAEDVMRLSDLQRQLLNKALDLIPSGGEVVFSTCSLQPEEGPDVVAFVLDRADIVPPTDMRWKPYLTEQGALRFLPTDGFDGFFVCLLRKK
ncbi:MAG: methyltransferase domain-containing protein [Alphaproteobacteria bacterium]|nr:methyltransferase domain-containing protein [Alphaproteobacteria bacterium]